VQETNLIYRRIMTVIILKMFWKLELLKQAKNTTFTHVKNVAFGLENISNVVMN
jgi:hypothetical protein